MKQYIHSSFTDEQTDMSEFLSPGMQAGRSRHLVSIDASKGCKEEGSHFSPGGPGSGWGRHDCR